MLDGMPDPDPFPGWMTPSDLAVYADSFVAGGFRGPVNRYRAQQIDFSDSLAFVDCKLAQPACFIGGERDIVRHMIPGMDMYDGIVDGYDNLCLQRLLPGVGHWVQQEQPERVSDLLLDFLKHLLKKIKGKV